MDGPENDAPDSISLETGETIYDDRGRVIGVVDEFTDEGFSVETVDGGPDVEAVDGTGDHGDEDEEDIPGKEFGEGYLMWRCEDCGEMGELEDDGIPEECPNCGAPKEHIHMAQED